MIKRWAHKGLRAFFETGSSRGIRPEHAARLRLILGRLNASTEPRDTTPESWMNQQTQYDLWKAGKKRKALEKKVKSLAA